jgi:MFS family permease
MKPLGRGQKRIVLALSVAVALTRWWALSASLWDWDEAQFASAVRSYDVVEHHPHPPGFPLYVAAAKLARFFTGDEFRALQLVNLVGACLLFPAVFFLAHQLGFSFATAVGGALITVFAPNVWFFGGTAFSDVPSLTLVVAAGAMLLASRQGPAGWLSAGSAALGVAAGFRPQNLLIGLVPFVLAGWPALRQGKWRTLLAAGLTMCLIVVGSYTGAVMASQSWKDYQLTVQHHQQRILHVDSFRAEERPGLGDVFDDFFVRQFGFRRASFTIFALVLVSILEAMIRRRVPPLLLLLTFLPFALFAWLFLDYISATRFSIAYMPLYGILAADGVGALTGLVRERWREAGIATGSVLIALALIAWAASPIQEVRNTPSPPVSAVRWIRENLSASTARLYVTRPMMAMADYMLPRYSRTLVEDERAVPLSEREAADAYVLAEGATPEPGGFNFLRSRRSRLWRIARPRYFEVSIIPLARRTQFLDGWYEAENEGADTWRWMGRRSLMILPPQRPPAALRMTLGVPNELVRVPVIRVTVNGKLVDEFRGTEQNKARSYVIENSRADAPSEVVIETDQWINPRQRGISDDPRDLGLVLRAISWRPADPSTPP